MFASFLPKLWLKFGRNGLKIFGGLNKKNLVPFLSQEFTPLTAEKRIMEKYFLIACLSETNRMMTISKLYLLRCRTWFLAQFLLRGLNGQHCAHGFKTSLKMSGRVLAFPFNSYLKFEFFKITGLLHCLLNRIWHK